MKRSHYILIFLMLITIEVSKGQVSTHELYIINYNNIERIDEWEFDFDSTGKLIDSLNKYQFLFDKNNDLVEKRTQYKEEWAPDGGAWENMKYIYDDNHNVIKREKEHSFLLASYTEYKKVINKCESYDDFNNIATSVINYQGGITETSIYKYVEGFYSELLVEKIIYLNGVISKKHKVIYTKNK